MADVETGPHDLTAHISKWAQNAFCHFGLTLVLSGMMAARASVVSLCLCVAGSYVIDAHTLLAVMIAVFGAVLVTLSAILKTDGIKNSL